MQARGRWNGKYADVAILEVFLQLWALRCGDLCSGRNGIYFLKESQARRSRTVVLAIDELILCGLPCVSLRVARYIATISIVRGL